MRNIPMNLDKYLSLHIILFFSCIAVFFTAQAETATQEEDQLVLTFLGTGAPRPSLERYGPSILVEAGDHKIIVDAGSGMRERLFQAGGFKKLTAIDTILITHLHFDHTISVPGLWLSGWLFGRRIPMHVYGPAGTEKMMMHLQEAYQWDIDYRGVVGVPLQGVELFSKDITPGVFFEKDGMKITAFAVEHMPVDFKTGKLLEFRGQTLGFRLDYLGRSVVFSGDTRSTKTSEILKYGKGVDVLIHEVQVPSPGNSKEAKLANISLPVHSTPKQTSYIFSETKPRMAVYSHIIPPNTTKEQLVNESRPYYKGPLTVAHDLMKITIGDKILVEKIKVMEEQSFEKSNVLQK
jgi:ribonuclease Z